MFLLQEYGIHSYSLYSTWFSAQFCYENDFDCDTNNPCDESNTAVNGYYFRHSDAAKFVQCDAVGVCFVMPCGAGTEWDDIVKTCGWPGKLHIC